MTYPSPYPWLLAQALLVAACLPCQGAMPSAPVPLEREAAWRIASFAKDARVQRRNVFDVAFQTNGVAWFAVSDGLYRYDGYQWQRFAATNGLPSSFVRTVKVARDGALWVGTDHGAGVFDGARFDPRGTAGHLAGPNVRRVVETADGALWFCCDRWPDPTSPGGLTRLREGKFKTYTMADGLPSDHVLDLFQQSNGRVIALTMAGPVVADGDRWVALPDPGYPPQDHTWTMQEAVDGSVYAQGWKSTLVYSGGRWSECPDPGASGTLPVCVTRDGAVIKAVQAAGGRLAFARWDGEGFARASAEAAEQGLSAHVMRQAPDGAIWAVGRGTIVRWEYLPGAWEWHPEFRRPLIEDRGGRLWFETQEGVAFLRNGSLEVVPGMRPPLVEDGQGTIWGGSEHGAASWADGQLKTLQQGVCGIDTVEDSVTDGRGRAWLQGTNNAGAHVVSALTQSGWKAFVLTPDQRKTVSLWADPGAGLWGVLSDGTSYEYDVVRVTEEGLKVQDLGARKPQTHLPRVCVSKTRFFLYAYNGLWESPLTEPLQLKRVEQGGGRVITRGTTIDDASAFLGQEGIDGQAAILLRRDDGWLTQRLEFGEALWFGRDGWLMAADGADMVLWYARDWNSATSVGLPIDTAIHSMLRSSAGEYWIGTVNGALRLRPKLPPPGTELVGPDKITAGALLKTKAIGITRFEPRSRAARYQLSWRIDGGPWSGYGEWPSEGIGVGNLEAGGHLLEARARDGLGNVDPTSAQLAFAIVPLPIQDQPWFRPLLAGFGLALGGLSAALYGVTRRLRRHSGRLEEEVKSRTAELRLDIVRREQLEETLRQSGRRFRAMVEQGADAITLIGAQGEVLYEGPTVPRLTGYSTEERLGRAALDMVHPEDAPSIRLILGDLIKRSGSIATAHFRAVRKDGTVWWAEGTATNLLHEPGVNAIVVNFRDITERKGAEDERMRLQDQLAQALKMESVGRLAGGVAHDFNNMLQVILGNISLALEEPGIPSSLKEHLLEVKQAAERSADLTRQLLAFARRQTVSPRVLDLNDPIAGTLKMLQRLIGEDIQLAWQPATSLWRIRLDPSQLDQLLANLSVNARDAIRGVGRITIRTSNATLTSENAEGLQDFIPGDYALLEVSDTGCGMDRETKSHLFEPFFTTKSVGDGTGLGLATVYGIVKQNGGLIGVESEPGQGTTFRLYFPRVDAVAPTPEDASSSQLPRGGETILLVEDEPAIVKLGQRILEGLGYRVLAAGRPVDALQVALGHPGTIDLVVTDLIMPGMSGRDLARQLRTRRPGLRCLYMSGYTADAIAREGMIEPGLHFLQKPFTREALALKVHEALEGETPV